MPHSRAWLTGWCRTLHLGAVVLVLVLARHIYLDAALVLAWFTLLSALVRLVGFRIVVTTALIHGLSPSALELLGRVLVLGLIPLTAALFVALRCTVPSGAGLARLRFRGEFEAQRALGIDPVRRQLMPRVVALLLSYLGVYGFTRGGLVGYMRGRWAGARRRALVLAWAMRAARRRRRFTIAAPFKWTCGVNR